MLAPLRLTFAEPDALPLPDVEDDTPVELVLPLTALPTLALPFAPPETEVALARSTVPPTVPLARLAVPLTVPLARLAAAAASASALALASAVALAPAVAAVFAAP